MRLLHAGGIVWEEAVALVGRAPVVLGQVVGPETHVGVRRIARIRRSSEIVLAELASQRRSEGNTRGGP